MRPIKQRANSSSAVSVSTPHRALSSSAVISSNSPKSCAKAVCLSGCKKPITDSCKALLCDFCNKWCHVECDGRFPAKIYNEISNTDAVLYMCKLCKAKHPQLPITVSVTPKLLTDIDSKIIDLQKNIRVLTEKQIEFMNQRGPVSNPVQSYSDAVSTSTEHLNKNQLISVSQPKKQLPKKSSKVPFSPERCVVLHSFSNDSLAINTVSIRQAISRIVDHPVIQFLNQYDNNDPKVIVQFEKNTSAESLMEKWNSNKEGCSIRRPNKKQAYAEGVAKGIPTSISEENLLEIFKSQFPSCIKIIRFLNKEKKPITMVKAVFKDAADLENSIHNGLYLKDYCMRIRLEKANPAKPRPIQCYNCWGFGHVAKFCKLPKACQRCSEPINTTNDHAVCDRAFKCCNCGAQDHKATDKENCPNYTQLVNKITQRIVMTTDNHAQ